MNYLTLLKEVYLSREKHYLQFYHVSKIYLKKINKYTGFKIISQMEFVQDSGLIKLFNNCDICREVVKQ